MADLGLNTLRVVRTSGQSFNCPMPFDPRSRELYVSEGSIYAVQIDSKRKRLVLTPPELEGAKRSPRDEDEDDEDRAPSFYWFMKLSPDGRELVATAHHGDSVALVLVDPRTAEGGARPLTRFGGFLDLNFASRRFYQGDHEEGPLVTTIEGERVAVLPELAGDPRDGTLSPRGDRVLIWDRPLSERPFLLWDLRSGTTRTLKAFGTHVTWFPDGSGFWFMKGNHELWRYDLGADAGEPFIQTKGVAWAEQSVGAWHLAPALSSDGRYMYAQLTEAKGVKGLFHAACVVDLEEKRVRQIFGRKHPHVTWLANPL